MAIDTCVSLFRCTCNAGLFSPNMYTGLAGGKLLPGIMEVSYEVSVVVIVLVRATSITTDTTTTKDTSTIHCNLHYICNASNSYQ